MENLKQKISLPIRWTDYEYNHRPKTSDWFWLVASGALLVIIAAILMEIFLLGVIAIVGAFAVIMMGAQKPEKIDFAIEKRGIRIGSTFYPFREIESFWINYDPPKHKELIVKSKKKIIKYIKVPLGDTNPNLIREFLKKILKEEEYEETFTDVIADKLGF